MTNGRVIDAAMLQRRFRRKRAASEHLSRRGITRRELMGMMGTTALLLGNAAGGTAPRLTLRRSNAGISLLLDGIVRLAVRRRDYARAGLSVPTLQARLSDNDLEIQLSGARYAATDAIADFRLSASRDEKRWIARIDFTAGPQGEGDLVEWLLGGSLHGTMRSVWALGLDETRAQLLVARNSKVAIDRTLVVHVGARIAASLTLPNGVGRARAVRIGTRPATKSARRSFITFDLATSPSLLPDRTVRLPSRLTIDIEEPRYHAAHVDLVETLHRQRADWIFDGDGGFITARAIGLSQSEPLALGQVQHALYVSRAGAQSHLLASLAPDGAELDIAGARLAIASTGLDPGLTLEIAHGQQGKIACSLPVAGIELPLGDFVVQRSEIPPDSRVSLIFDWPSRAPPEHWCTLHLNSGGEPSLKLQRFTTSILRPHDLVVLGFAFTGVAIRSVGGKAFLFKEPGTVAVMRVDLPPQHIAEVDLKPKRSAAGGSQIPSPDNPGAPQTPIDSRPVKRSLGSALAAPSRLVFDLPDYLEREGLPLSIETLLDWSAFQMRVSDLARPATDARPPLMPAHWDASLSGGSVGRSDAPDDKQTALNIPAGMILSPHRWSTWLHSIKPVTRSVNEMDWPSGRAAPPRTELWTTRLAPFVVDSVGRGDGAVRSHVVPADGADPRRRDDLRTIRAISATPSPEMPRLEPNKSGADWEVQPFLPDPKQINTIVKLTSSTDLTFTNCDFSVTPYDPIPLTYDRFALSALGASVAMRATWPLGIKDVDGSPIETVEYNHRIETGRDDYVSYDIDGFTLWTGHEVVLVEARPRESLKDEHDGFTAALRRRYWCEVRETVRNYSMPHGGDRLVGRRTPFQKVTLWPSKTCFLDEPVDLHPSGSEPFSAFWMIPEGGPLNKPFEFTITTQDWNGRISRFSMPLLWIRAGLAARVFNVNGTTESVNPHLKTIVDTFYSEADSVYAPWRTAVLNGQRIGVIPDPAKGERDRTLEVEEIDFSVDLLSDDVRWPAPCSWPVHFYPAATELRARAGASARFGSASAKRAYRYNGWYAAYGFGPLIGAQDDCANKPVNQGGVYLDIVAPPYQAGPAFRFPPEKSGGIAQPSIDIRHIALNGPVGGVPLPVITPIAYVPKPTVAQCPPALALAGGAKPFVAGSVSSYLDSPIIQGRFEPQDICGDDMKLFGAVRFADICRPLSGIQEVADAIPRLEEEYKKAISPILANIDTAKAEIERLRALASDVASAVESLLNLGAKAEQTLRLAIENIGGTALLDARDALLKAVKELEANLLESAMAAFAKVDALYDAAYPDDYVARMQRVQKDLAALRNALDVNALIAPVATGFQGLSDAINAFTSSGFPFGRYRAIGTVVKSAFETLKGAITNPMTAITALTALRNALADIDALANDPAPVASELRAIAALRTNCDTALTNAATNLSMLANDVSTRVRNLHNDWFDPPWPNVKAKDIAFNNSRDEAFGVIEAALNSFADAVNDSNIATAVTTVAAPAAVLTKKLADFAQDAVSALNNGLDDATGSLRGICKSLGDAIHPLLVQVDALAASIPQSIDLNYGFEPALTDSGPFQASLQKIPARLKIAVRLTQNLVNASAGPDFAVDATLSNCALVIPPSSPFLTIGFEQIMFTARNGASPDIHIKLGPILFAGQLDFVAALQALLNPTSGPYMTVDGDAVTAGFRVPLPAITSGAFSLVDLAINSEIKLPLDGSPMRGRLAISSRAKPAVMAIGIYGGTMFAAVETLPDRALFVEGAIDGGLVGVLSCGVATGVATATIGIYFKLQSETALLTGYFRAHGCFDVCGLITLNIEFYLGFTYQDGSAVGVCVVTVTIGHGMFAIDVHVTAERKIAGGGSSAKTFNSTQQKSAVETWTEAGPQHAVFRLSESAEAWDKWQARFGDWTTEGRRG